MQYFMVVFAAGAILIECFLLYRMIKDSCTKEEDMSQNHWAVYMLPGEPNVYVYTTTKCQNTKDLLEVLGFKYQHTLYAYGWSCTDGHMYSVPKYFNMADKDRMLRLVRINNGTDTKIRTIYREIMDAQAVERQRWWEYYSK